MIVFFTIIITIAGYLVSRVIFNKFKNPLLNPVVLTTVMVIGILALSGLKYEDYEPGKERMTFLLGPATVALALPLYHNRKRLWAGFIPVLLGVAVGSVINIIAMIFLGQLAGFDNNIIASLVPKSITAPIAIEVVRIIGGDPSLAAVFVVMSGMIGSMIGPILLTRLRIYDPIARGLAMGTTSHGQGTAVALAEGETQGAMSGVAMAFAAVITSFVAPFLIPLFL